MPAPTAETNGPDAPVQGFSRYLYLALALLLLTLAVVIGIRTIVHPSVAGEGLSAGWRVVGALGIAGIALLLAQSGSKFWQETASIASASARRGDTLLIALLTALAIVPRWPVQFHSLWYDEIWTVRFMRSGPLYALTHQSGYNNHLLNSLLGSLLLQARQVMTGQSALDSLPPAWLVRLPAFLFGVASVPMLYIAARDHIERPAVAIAAVLLALSPTAVDFSGQTRGYSALIFFAIAQTFWLTRALRTGTPGAWIGWLACATLGTLTHLYFLFVFGVDGLFVLALAVWITMVRKNGRAALALVEQGLLMALIWAALSYVCYVGVLPALQKTQEEFQGADPTARAHEVLVPMLQSWGGIPQGSLLTVYYVACTLLALAGLVYLMQRRSGAALFLPLLLIVPPIVVEVAQPHYVFMRFFIFLLPGFLTLLACGLWGLSVGAQRVVRGPGFAPAGLATLLTAGFVALTLPGLWEIIRLPKQDFQGAAGYLRREMAQGWSVAGIGLGSEWFDAYDVHIPLPLTVQELRDLVKARKRVLLVDTDMLLHPHRHVPDVYIYARRCVGRPLKVFPGRFPHWPSLYLDGDSEIKIYLLTPKDLPPTLPPGRPSPADAPGIEEHGTVLTV